MNALTTHNYNGFAISQDRDKYTSLTDMARACGKFVADYLRLDSTTEYLQELSRSMGLTTDQLIRIKRDGKNNERGTWAHPEVAIDFAQWCNVSFRIWANRTLRGVIENQQPNKFTSDLSIRTLEIQLAIAQTNLEALKIEKGIITRDPISVKAQPKTKVKKAFAPRIFTPKVPVDLSLLSDAEIEYAIQRIELKVLRTASPISIRDLYRNIAEVRNLANRYSFEVNDLTLNLCRKVGDRDSCLLIQEQREKGLMVFLKAK